jgi:hypothetical protein
MLPYVITSVEHCPVTTSIRYREWRWVNEQEQMSHGFLFHKLLSEHLYGKLFKTRPNLKVVNTWDSRSVIF